MVDCHLFNSRFLEIGGKRTKIEGTRRSYGKKRRRETEKMAARNSGKRTAVSKTTGSSCYCFSIYFALKFSNI